MLFAHKHLAFPGLQFRQTEPSADQGMSEVSEDDSTRMEMEASTYSQVVFLDVLPTYPLHTPLTCIYQLTGGLVTSSKDWVGLFKVGWESIQKYHCFEWAVKSEPHTGPEPHSHKIVFNGSGLPQMDEDDYQFCYIDSSRQVKGASTPFSFRNPTDSSLDYSLDTDILVVATQEQVETMEKEKLALKMELELLKEEKMIVRNELDDRMLEIIQVREQVEKMEKENLVLQMEMKELKEEKMIVRNELDERLIEILHLRKHMEELRAKSSSESSAVTQNQQFQSHTDEESEASESLNNHSKKYERAMQKIHTLMEERERQQTQNAELTSKLKKSEQDINRLQDQLQLLQVDIKSSRKDNESLRAELELQVGTNRDLENEKKDLMESMLSQVPPEGVSMNTKMQIETLEKQLTEVRNALLQESQNYHEAKKQAEAAELELKEMKKLDNRTEAASWKVERSQIVTKLQETERKFVQHVDRAASVELENAKLSRDNEGLKKQVQDLVKLMSEMRPSSPAANSLQHLDSFGSVSTAQGPSQSDPLYDSIQDPAAEINEARVCRHCQERFPGISEDELASHEQAHKVCPFCTLICDALSQAEFEDHVYDHEE